MPRRVACTVATLARDVATATRVRPTHTALGGLKYKFGNFGEAMPMANSATSLRRGDEN